MIDCCDDVYDVSCSYDDVSSLSSSSSDCCCDSASDSDSDSHCDYDCDCAMLSEIWICCCVHRVSCCRSSFCRWRLLWSAQRREEGAAAAEAEGRVEEGVGRSEEEVVVALEVEASARMLSMDKTC